MRWWPARRSPTIPSEGLPVVAVAPAALEVPEVPVVLEVRAVPVVLEVLAVEVLA